MTLRRRLALIVAVAVAVAVAASSLTAFIVVRGQLRGQVDDALRQTQAATAGLTGAALPAIRGFAGRGAGLPPEIAARVTAIVGDAQILTADGGTVALDPSRPAPPVGPAARDVAAGRRGATFSEATAGGVHVRVLTSPLAGGGALQFARPLTEVDRTLRRLGFVLVVVTLIGVALAVVVGLSATRAALAPVRRLTDVAEEVSATRDLTRRTGVAARGHGGTHDDEVTRLARSFDAMLDALEASEAAQRRLVADASHELRTPLTSLRTNVEVLARAGGMPAADRERLLADLTEQLSELSELVGDLVDLARPGAARGELVDAAEIEDVRLDQLVAEQVARARRHAPTTRFDLDAEPAVVAAAPARLARAVHNLLDNAAKFGPPGGAVEVTVRATTVAVRDHGPGIAAADRDRVFERFYRGDATRGRPGSGLGLAIVRQVAVDHGGTITLEPAPGGGTLAILTVPAGEDAEPPRAGVSARRFGDESKT